jgi:hypothetical protein
MPLFYLISFFRKRAIKTQIKKLDKELDVINEDLKKITYKIVGFLGKCTR